MHEETAVIFSLLPEEAERISKGQQVFIQVPRKPKVQAPFMGFGFVQIGRYLDKERTTPKNPAWLSNGQIVTSLDRTSEPQGRVNGLVALQFMCSKVHYDENAVLYDIAIENVQTLRFPRELNTFKKELADQCKYADRCAFVNCNKYPCEDIRVKPPTYYCYVTELVREDK